MWIISPATVAGMKLHQTLWNFKVLLVRTLNTIFSGSVRKGAVLSIVLPLKTLFTFSSLCSYTVVHARIGTINNCTQLKLIVESFVFVLPWAGSTTAEAECILFHHVLQIDLFHLGKKYFAMDMSAGMCPTQHDEKGNVLFGQETLNYVIWTWNVNYISNLYKFVYLQGQPFSQILWPGHVVPLCSLTADIHWSFFLHSEDV